MLLSDWISHLVVMLAENGDYDVKIEDSFQELVDIHPDDVEYIPSKHIYIISR